jgi:transcriptional regulator with XRE-family HTH domain
MTSTVSIMGTTEGPGDRLARNVKQLRERRGLTVRQLSAALTELGRPILPSGITKIENRDRRVDADDLIALALALGVTPNRLLLTGDIADDTVTLTPAVETSRTAAWWWATGEQRLPGPYAVPDDRQFGAENRPHDPPDVTTLADLRALEASGVLEDLRRGVSAARTAGLSAAGIAELVALWELDQADRDVRGVRVIREEESDGQR